MERGTSYRRLLSYLRPYVWPRFVGGAACMLVFSATTFYLPFLIRNVFDDIFAARDWAMLAWLPVLSLLVFAVRSLANYGSSYLIEWVAQKIVVDFRKALNERVQHLPLSFFNRTPTGAIVSRATSDVTQVNTALTQSTIALLQDTTSLIALLAAAFVLDWSLALIAFVGFPIAVLPVIQLSSRLRRHARAGQEALGTLAALLQETAQGNRVVKAFGMEAYEQERFAAESRRVFHYQMKATRARAFIQPIMEMLAAFGAAGVIWYGGYSVLSGTRTQGAFLGFMAALMLVYEPFKRLAKVNSEIQRGLASASRVFEILDEPDEIDERAGALALGPLSDAIRLEAVRFQYPKRAGDRAAAAAGAKSEGLDAEAALDGIDLTLKRGEAVAVVGASGGGKSTLADLIPRFCDPTSGRVTVDGTDLREVTLASLRDQIGIVTQFTFLFNDTIRANIAYGSSVARSDEVEAAARAAHAHEFISELPDGYDTVVGELGVMLSGGQRQRLAIARALMKNAPILILDEATSALDSESERLVQDAIDHLMDGRTTLVIAHRFSTIRRCHRIVVLDRGRIIEEGTHEELYERRAAYRSLHDQQALAHAVAADADPRPA
ncbi:MAG: ABC transporter transmembrane domain-containing protein [Candidatus Binatia bacterium]|nr:ABC transporter transmembrane domain-containing protein [Candidatus Binatia bacterium]